MDQKSAEAVKILNERRPGRGAGALVMDGQLTARCQIWAAQMAKSKDFKHDPDLQNRPGERENIAMSTAGLTPKQAIDMWETSAPHTANMYDTSGFGKSDRAGYAEVDGYACLRLCSVGSACK